MATKTQKQLPVGADGKWQCPKCGKRYQTRGGLGTHTVACRRQQTRLKSKRTQQQARDPSGKLAKAEVERALEDRAGRVITGRAQLLQLLDRCVSYEPNLKHMKDAFNAAIEKDALKFFRDFVMPLLPKETLVRMFATQTAGIHVVFSGVEVPPLEGAPREVSNVRVTRGNQSDPVPETGGQSSEHVDRQTIGRIAG